MEATELSKKVSEKITDLYKYMHTVESCDALVEQVKDMRLVFEKETEEGNEIVDVSNMLSEGQLENAKGIIIAMLNGNKEDANKVLEQFLTFEAKENVKKFGDGSDDEEENEKEVEQKEPEQKEQKKKTQASKVDVGKMQALLKAGWTQKDVAEEFGVTKNVIASLIRKHGR